MNSDKVFLSTAILAAVVALLVIINIDRTLPPRIESPSNIIFDRAANTIYLDSLTLKQKIAQMVVTAGAVKNKEAMQKMLIGGIYFGAEEKKEDYVYLISTFQQDAVVPFFVTIDMEGYRNPFENFRKFPTFSEIKTKEEAYNIGDEEGRLLKELGFNVNFAPVVDLEDDIWNCRSFLGTPEEIAEKADYYINGLQKNGIIATSKHYPGKTLSTMDPHKFIVGAVIEESDLLPFEKTIENNVSAVMVSHLIVTGFVDSESKPSVVSEKIVGGLRNKFTGLIITDEISMFGLRDYYKDKDKMYIDLFSADNDIVLNFDNNIRRLSHMVDVVADAVERGIISEERIDNSVAKILNAKGINVK